jgi:hypothetical protein
MDAKNFAIGILSVTAAILLTTVVLLSVLAPKPVQGFAMLDQGSGYTMYTSQVDESRENLTIISHQAGLMNIYRYEINTSRLAPLQQIPLPPPQVAGR